MQYLVGRQPVAYAYVYKSVVAMLLMMMQSQASYLSEALLLGRTRRLEACIPD